MPLEKEKQGLLIKEYQQKLEDGTHALRIGKEVPEGDVNLAYIHTPSIQSDENISLIDTSYTSDNVIPQDQLESMVVANGQGELEYVDMIGNGEVRPRPPKGTFPSNNVNVTRKFKKNDMRAENALFYRFDINYHYDSKPASLTDEGVYVTEKYTGQQIELTDENGNLLNDTYKYDIYVHAHEVNPRIYSVRIYLHKNTTKNETIKVRYNHIDQVVKDEHVQSVRNQIEFYTNKNNELTVDNQNRHMLEGGKLRIVNGVSAFEEKTEDEVIAAMSLGGEREIFAVVPKPNGEGYKIIVPQRSESDPRVPRIFTHRVVAEYTGSDQQKVKVSVGHITDWCINPEALLKNEQTDYSKEWKDIGIPAGEGKLNAKEMIELSLPFGTPGIPVDATFYIEDDQGNLLYHINTLTNNENVDTKVNGQMSNAVEAKANNLTQAPWKNAMQDNTVVKNNPIPHVCSVIPERQPTKWDFQWKATGQGYTEQTTTYKTNWRACANIGFKKSIEPKILDLLDKSKWSTIGNASDVNKWQYKYVQEMGKNVVEYLENAGDVMGFYQTREHIDGQSVNMMSKSDYQFSAKVRLTDPIDDDAIGILFRVNNAQNYYMFVWEKDKIETVEKTYTFDHGEGVKGTKQGMGRILLDEHGYTAVRYIIDGKTESWKYTGDQSKYLNQMGFGNNHKRLFRATPSTKAPSPEALDSKVWDGKTRYPTDQTNCQFTDITNMSSNYNAKGWDYGKDYKITVTVTGSLFRIYISENVNSADLGQLVCQGTDSTHQQGTYGIFCISQRWTYWYDLMMTEIAVESVCTDKTDVVLTDTTEKKLSNYAVTDMLAPLIRERAATSFKGAPYEVFGYSAHSDGEFNLRIDRSNDFLYGKTNNPAAGGIARTTWTTDDNGLSVNGTGKVEYHSDGHFTIITSTDVLPSEQVPKDVLSFAWNTPTITAGENVAISLVQPNRINVTASVPPIQPIGKPYVLPESEILKSDGLKNLAYLFDANGESGFYKELQIPTSIPLEDVLLRLERGVVTGVAPNGAATTQNPEYRVNYRFRCEKDGFMRLPVDQFQHQLGINRLRLKSILKGTNEVDPKVTVGVSAWTTFQDLEAVPLFAVKVEEQRKVEIEKPKVEQRHMEVDNWYLRIKNGRFLKRIVLPYHEIGSAEKPPEIYITYPQLLGMVASPNEVIEVDLEYSLPEYTNQEFHNRPFVLMDKESPVILNEYAIQTRFAPLVLHSSTGRSYLEVYSNRGNQRRGLRVADVDAAKGIVYLHDRIREQDQVYVRYAYQEDWFTYRGFTKESNFFHLDLNPTPGHRHTIAVNGMHRWIPIDRDEEKYTALDTVSTELLVKQVHVYMRPTAIRSVNYEGSSQNGGTIIPGTVRTKTIFHTDEEWWFNPTDYKYDPTMLRLGKVLLQANSNRNENMTILDTRTRGGGLDEGLSKEIIRQVNKESLYNWDIGYFDGEAYQENGVIVVRIPRSILKSDRNPSGFHESDVQQAIAKHKAYGVLPIIEYYDEVVEKNRTNMLPNPEFLHGKHIGYYDPVHSSGAYELRHMALGSGDNDVLQVTDNGEYAITLPGHKFIGNKYRLDIKAMKEQTAPARSAGTIDIAYNDGTFKRVQMSKINRDQWMVYKEEFTVDANVHHIKITLNKTSETRIGRIIYDYIMLHPILQVSEETTEIHEI